MTSTAVVEEGDEDIRIELQELGNTLRLLAHWRNMRTRRIASRLALFSKPVESAVPAAPFP